MATKVVMEALSPTMEEGRLIEWKKQEGESVAVGDVLAEVETDKAVMELVARAAGTLLKHLVPAGATVPVADPVGIIGEPGEAIEDAGGGAKPAADEEAVASEKEPEDEGETGASAPSDAPPRPARPATAPAPAAPAARPAAQTEQAAAPAAAAPARGGRIKASPLARKIAAERGLDLEGVTGSGPAGRIVERDLAGLEPRAPNGAGAPSAPAFQPAASGEPFENVPLTQIRKTIARRLSQSIGPIPTFYLTTEIDMER